MYTNCSIQPIVRGADLGQNPSTQRSKTHFPNSTVGIANNKQGFSVAYDENHNYNSTAPRRIGLQSWLGLPNNANFDPSEGHSGSVEVISEAWCNLTQTYVEAQVYCMSPNNCTVTKIRSSLQPHNSSVLSALDGVKYPWAMLDIDPSKHEEYEAQYRTYARTVAKTFFNLFVKATSTSGVPENANLSPLESYFSQPDAPYKASLAGKGNSGAGSDQRPIAEVGDRLFSWRLAQLLNTYWLASIEPFSLVSGIDLDMIDGGETATIPTTNGHMYVERIVLRCHKAFFVVLILISIGLFLVGLATTYMDATRKGPDVLDDFVNALRHNPYVHIDKLAPTMADGQELARALRSTVVQMGDVRPDASVGYIAIGTPNEIQPVERLRPRRQ